MNIIEFDQIRAGDTVERNLEGIKAAMTVADRDRVKIITSEEAFLLDHIGSVWTLLDRPKAAVELPSVPTLGWLAVTDDGTFDRAPASVLSIWRNRKYNIEGGLVGSWSHEFVNAFTETNGNWATPSESEMRAFLAAVDKAANA